MLNYDDEAHCYDASRGGDARAAAAARAVITLLPHTIRDVLDLAGGTGIVSQSLASDNRNVCVVDAAAGMLRLANHRLPGRAVRATATALPLRDNSFDAVSCVWLLHLLDRTEVANVMVQVTRVLRVGGRFVTTVNKNHSANDHSDIGMVLKPLRDNATGGHAAADDPDYLQILARKNGLDMGPQSWFTGHGQGKNPEDMHTLLPHWFHDAPTQLIDNAQDQLRRLPRQQQLRPGPRYQLRSFIKVS